LVEIPAFKIVVRHLVLAASAMLATCAPLFAHNGPPFPVITDRTVGNYIVSLWADPDTSDDGDADGRFWVVVKPAANGDPLPADTVVRISIGPADRSEEIRTQTAAPDERESSRRTASFVIDREGKYDVKATLAGPLGPAEIETTIDAAYAERPGPVLLAVYPMPFLLIGFLWLKLLLRRRAHKLA
jgi:hypothetical protein